MEVYHQVRKKINTAGQFQKQEEFWLSQEARTSSGHTPGSAIKALAKWAPSLGHRHYYNEPSTAPMFLHRPLNSGEGGTDCHGSLFKQRGQDNHILNRGESHGSLEGAYSRSHPLKTK